VSVVHVVVPDSIDDPTRPSGGNAYDRRICDGLAATGWSVHEHAVVGSWPRPNRAACAALKSVIAGIPDGALVLLDGLVASTLPEILVPEAARLRLAIVVHMPLSDELPSAGIADARVGEEGILSAAVAVITTSRWARGRLLDLHSLLPEHVHVAEPGVDSADLAPGTTGGGELLCVGALTHGKGHDVLLAALARVADLPWRCVCVGTLNRDPDLADRLRRQASELGIGDRVFFPGARTGEDLDASYAAADVLVLASRAETYGMVVTEALARGLPVIASAVGGVPEALGHGSDGSPPGLLVEPDDPAALAGALRGWLGDAGLRHRLRRSAKERRLTLCGWSGTTEQISQVLAAVAR
jgi:glycosyltransferase involved in cell wall biosynthesis